MDANKYGIKSNLASVKGDGKIIFVHFGCFTVRPRIAPALLGDYDLINVVLSDIQVIFNSYGALHGYHIFPGISTGYQSYVLLHKRFYNKRVKLKVICQLSRAAALARRLRSNYIKKTVPAKGGTVF